MKKPEASLQSWLVAGASIALALFAVYAGAALLSVVVAHVAFVFNPDSALVSRLTVPLVSGLEFLDNHWKAALIMIFPFVEPIARDLLPRLRKAGAVEFDAPIPLEPQGVREKPGSAPAGAA